MSVTPLCIVYASKAMHVVQCQAGGDGANPTHKHDLCGFGICAILTDMDTDLHKVYISDLG